MFSDDTDLSCFHIDIKPLFENLNNELEAIPQWFEANSLVKCLIGCKTCLIC